MDKNRRPAPASLGRPVAAGGLLAALLISAPSLAADDYIYRTRHGDTLIAIGQRLLARPADWPRLQELNGIADPRHMSDHLGLRIPVRLLRRDGAPARVIAVQGQVESGGAALLPGATVAEGAAPITTGQQSFVTLELVDGSRLTLQPSSRLRLEQLARYRNTEARETGLRLEAGRVESVVSKQGNTAGRFLIKTPSAAIGVRGTRFRVSLEGDDGASRAEVTEGAVGVQGAGKAAALAAGFGLVVGGDGKPGESVALLPAPHLADLPRLQERPVLRFATPPLADARAYRFQIGRDAEMRAVLAETVSPRPEAKFAGLGDGNYVLRVRGIDRHGLEGQDGEFAFRVKARPEPPFAVAPINGSTLRGETVEIAWTQAEEADRYRLQLADEPSFAKPLADSDQLRQGKWQPVATLAPGSYYWRGRSIRADGDLGPWGDAQGFSLRALPADPGPPQVSDDELSFAWPGEPGQRFLFQFASDAQFASLIAEQQLERPTVTLPRPDAGRYSMRVRATDGDGFVGPFTRPQTIEVPARPPWWLLLLVLPWL